MQRAAVAVAVGRLADGAMENPKAFASGHDAVSRVANKDKHAVAADLLLLFMAGGDLETPFVQKI